MADRVKIKVNHDTSGTFYCPTCGHELAWDTSESQADRGLTTEDDLASVHIYHCEYCGTTVEAYEAHEDERPEYPFYNESLKDKFEEI